MDQKIKAADLQHRLSQSKALVLLEALPARYFHQGHLPSALNAPLELSDEELEKLIPHKASEIVTYCTGLTCPNSILLAKRLEKLGYQNVSAFEEGKEGWVRLGLHLKKEG